MSERQGPAVRLTEHELSEIRMLIEERTGICFDESRERFFSTRVREHLAAQKLASGTELLRVIRKTNVEYEAFLERLLTQETSFFRYPGVYEAFEKRVLPELHTKKFWKDPRTLRVWSAGCSTGEEPYSIAITIADALSFADTWKLEILATDVSRNALKRAERGIYTGRSLGSVSDKQLETHFTKVKEGHQVKPRLKKMVTFTQMNLASAVYVGRMDLIFCMNVLIYFSEERRRTWSSASTTRSNPAAISSSAIPNPSRRCPSNFRPSCSTIAFSIASRPRKSSQKPELVTEELA